jgi:peptidoglycan/xylan/chitin deacetylase (PgdA/CDA1 family)
MEDGVLIRRRLAPSLAAAAITAAALAACGDGTGPETRVVALDLPDSVRVDAIRDSVRLPAELVFADGQREPLSGGVWSGAPGDAATLYPDGWIWTRANGEFTATVTYDTLSANTRVVIRREGRIVITFDDGWRSARTVALPALQDAGLVGNVAVVTGTLGWPAFLDRQDMQDLHDAGWAFVSHSVTHGDLTTLSEAELEAELTQSREWILAEQLRFGDVFVVPYHEWGDRERNAIRRHYAAARGATVDATDPTFVAEWRPADSYSITTIDGSALARTHEGRQEVMAWVLDAIVGGFLLDIMFHDVPPEETHGFLALVDALANVRHRVSTWADLYPLADDD